MCVCVCGCCRFKGRGDAGKAVSEGGRKEGEKEEEEEGGGEGGVEGVGGWTGPAGPFVLKLICAATLNWLQQLINVLESWHKKFI